MDKMGVQRGNKHVALSDLSIHYTGKNIEISYRNNKFEISETTWMKKLNCLMDLTLSVSDIQHYYILIHHQTAFSTGE